MPNIEVVALVVEIVHLRQAGVSRLAVEDQVVRGSRLQRHAARRLIGQVDQALHTVRHRLGLPLALSAEALIFDCVEVSGGQLSHN